MPKGSQLSKLTPVIDQAELLRSKSRLQNLSWLAYEFKCQLILPKAHPLSFLIIRSFHEKFGYPLGMMATINELNKGLWILGQRAMIKKVQYECARCQIENTKPAQPLMGDLPSFRFATPWRAFSAASVDFAGPFLTV